MLVQAFKHRPHGDDLGDDAERRAACQYQEEAESHWHAHAGDKQRAQYTPQHAECARSEAEYT